MDDMALDVHPEDGAGVSQDLSGIRRQFDATSLAPASHLHLGFDDNRVAEPVRHVEQLARG